MGRFVDSVITYRILKLLVTPFDKTKAFQLGIIDSKGKELKKMRQLNTVAEKKSHYKIKNYYHMLLLYH